MLQSSSLSPSPSSSSTLASLSLHDVLVPGDIVGEGSYLKGHVLRLVANNHHSPYQQPAVEFQVIKELGKGSYAVVYLVQEIISKSQEDDNDHMSTIGLMDIDINNYSDKPTCYGRKFAIKCLSKANLDQDALAIQMSEVTIHQSLPLHPNIVTLHRTLETPAYLLLLLEYVPGEDLFYFLEQSRDHDDLNHYYDDDSSPLASSHTPPTPSLLSTLHPSQLLSKTRLRLIASMFSQMCDAVATCHAHQVFHRDIKPENFIVTDGIWTAPDGSLERKVVVKLSDFGLSTKDVESSDMDCGSAPYMSYECRNNIAPTYGPRAADVWSLGIVLINMLYHSNPWTDTAEGACPSFWLFRQDPVSFFMNRLTGMTQPVADLLATRIFCVLDNPLNDSPRMSAAEFGVWVRNRLPMLLSGDQKRMSTSGISGHRQSLTMPVSHRPTSRPPSVYSVVNRAPSIVNATVIGRSLSRAPSLKLEPALEREELSVVLDQEEEAELERDEDKGEQMLDLETASRSTSTTKRRKRGLRKGKGAAASSCSTPTPSVSSHPTSPTSLQDETCLNLAAASQSLVREISKASKAPSSKRSISSMRLDSTSTSRLGMEIKTFEPASMFAVPSALLSIPHPPTVNATANVAQVPAPVTKKPSKWKLGFGKNNATAVAANGHISPQDDPSSPQPSSVDPSLSSHTPAHMSTTASNVTNLIMGLDPSLPVPSHANGNKDHAPHQHLTNGHSGGGNYHVGGSHREGTDGMMVVPMGMGIGIGKGTWPRGRRGRMAGGVVDDDGSALNSTSSPHSVPPLSSGSPLKHQSLNQGQSSGSRPYQDPWSAFQDRRAVSPHSLRSGYGHSHGHPGTGGCSSPPSPSSSSAISNSTNWRSSMSTVSSVSMSSGSSSCVSVVSGSDGGSGGNGRGGVGAGMGRAGFTRFNNSSVSTAASSVSSSSWRTSVKSVGGGAGGGRSKYGNIPKNVKPIDGVPWQLDQLPRGMYSNPTGDIFGSPPVRKQRTRKNKELGGGALGGSGGLSNLDTICERSVGVGVGGDGGKAQAQEALGNGVGGTLRDASTSTTDLAVVDVSGGAVGKEDVDASGCVGANGGGVKKVQKGQIHALAKMLSALRR